MLNLKRRPVGAVKLRQAVEDIYISWIGNYVYIYIYIYIIVGTCKFKTTNT